MGTANTSKQLQPAAALIELGDRFRDVEDPGEIAFAAAKIPRRPPDGSRASQGTIHNATETTTIERYWNAPGIRSVAGARQIRDYGSYIEAHQRSETVVFANADDDPRTAANADALEANSV